MNTTKKGDALENRIYELLQSEIAADRFWAKQSCCKLFKKKGYFSKDRGSQIIFDLSIELYLPGQVEYSALVLIECKNYGHSVPVDDAEEFHAKVQQIGAAKPIIASTASFQSGARAFAKSKGIGLLRYFDSTNFKWELNRSASASADSNASAFPHLVSEGLSSDEFKSEVYDFYFQSPFRDTNSLWDFIEDLVCAAPNSTDDLNRIANSRRRLVSHIPFLNKAEIESEALAPGVRLVVASLDLSRNESGAGKEAK